jgi:hypothetical protein
MGDHLHSSSSCVSDDECRVINQQFVEIPTVVLDGWSSVMSIGDYLPWVSVGELSVKSLGLTKAYDTFQSFSQLHIYLLAFPDTSIIDSSTGGDRQWQGTWRVGTPRPLDRSVFIAYSRTGMDHQRQIVEALSMMESILDHRTEDISEIDTDSDSPWDEDGGFLIVISMVHQQLVGIGSDELPNLPWDPGVNLVKDLLDLMRVRVVPASSRLHSWITLRGLVGICSMWRDRFSLLIIVIEFGDGWEDFGSTGIPLQV